MNAKELEKLTICRRCPDQQRCGVWADFVNSEDREEMEKEEGFELAIVITRCPSLTTSERAMLDLANTLMPGGPRPKQRGQEG